METLLRKRKVLNPEHKEKFRERLADLSNELGEDELSVVAGGVREAEPPVPEDWMK